MRFSDELVEEIRSRNDIVDVISSYVHLNKRGSNYFGLCPFHNEKTGSFSVTPSKQMFYCFGCHEGGNVITFLQKYENYTFSEALKVLAERASITLPDNMSSEDKARENRRATILAINKEAAKYYYVQLRNKVGERGFDYFKNRGLSDETMQKFGLGYAKSGTNETYRYLKNKGFSDELLRASGLFVYRENSGMTDKFWNRVIFPILDANHRVIAFGGRVMGDGEPKYLNSPETEVFDKSRNMYGLSIAKSSKAKNIIICEGYMDVISLHQAGFDQAVASLGTAFTSGHANLIERYAREKLRDSDVIHYKDILLCYDSDGAGSDATKRALTTLREAGLNAKVINMKPYKDPDEFIKNLGAEEFAKRIDEAENGFMFEIRMLEDEYDIKDPSGKTSFLNDVASRILRFSERVERENYIGRVAGKYMVSPESLDELVKKNAMKAGNISKSLTPKQSHNVIKQEDPIVKTWAMLLNTLSENPDIWSKVKKYISADDFTDEIYNIVAKELFEQLDEDKIDPAKILSGFTDEEEASKVAGLFHQNVEHIETVAQKNAALSDLIVKVKEHSMKSNVALPEGVDPIKAMIEQKDAISELKQGRITFFEA